MTEQMLTKGNSPFLSRYSPVVLMDLNLPWERILHLGIPVSFVSKQIFSVVGTNPGQGFYYVRKGRIRLSYITPNGQEKVLFYVGRGTLFNEIPTMSTIASCVFTCMEPVSAVFFKTSFVRSHQFIAQYPDIMLNWVEAVSEKNNIFFNQICNAGLYDSFGNVCRLLCRMFLHSQQNGKVVPQLSQQECASLLGIHRGSLHKALTRLKKEGIIGNYTRRSLEIIDADRLFQYAEE